MFKESSFTCGALTIFLVPGFQDDPDLTVLLKSGTGYYDMENFVSRKVQSHGFH